MQGMSYQYESGISCQIGIKDIIGQDTLPLSQTLRNFVKTFQGC